MSDDSSKTSQAPEKLGASAPAPSKFIAAIEVAISTVVILIFPSIIASYVLLAFSSGLSIDQTVQQFIYVVIVELLVLGILVWLIRQFKLSWRGIGVLRPKWKSLPWALLGFAMYIVSYMLIFALVDAVITLDTEQRQELGFEPGVGGLGLLLVFISLVILPPVIEEIIFRGYLYTRLRRAFKVLPAAIIVSILFSLGHLQLGSGNIPLWVAALDTFVLSMVLIWLREKTGNIWAGVGVHAMKNALAFTSLFLIAL